jgi:hypothetical protein
MLGLIRASFHPHKKDKLALKQNKGVADKNIFVCCAWTRLQKTSLLDAWVF